MKHLVSTNAFSSLLYTRTCSVFICVEPAAEEFATHVQCHPLQQSRTLLTEPQPNNDSMDSAKSEERPRPELSIQLGGLASSTRAQPSIINPFSLIADGSRLLDSHRSETSSPSFDPDISAPHLRIGQYVRVKVKILRVRNLDKNCANILLQNRFLYENQDPYSTNIYDNNGQCCEVNHLHVYRIKVSSFYPFNLTLHE